MHIRTLLTAALLSASPAWAINKCVQDGRVVYQEAACPGSGEIVGNEVARREAEARQRKAETEQRAVAQENMARISERWEQDRKLQREKVCKGKFYDEPVVGMTEDVVQNCTRFWENYGAGARVNETETAAGISRQYVFNLRNNIRYLYTTRGIVTAIQR